MKVLEGIGVKHLTGVRTPCYLEYMTNTRTLKVSIPISVEIDVDAWADEYGAESAAEIRADVKEHIRNMVLGQLDSLGVLA